MNLKELKNRVFDSSGSDEISLEYINQEGSYGVTFKKVKGGYQAIETNYYHLIDTPFDATPEHFTPAEGEVITDEQFKELRAFIEEIRAKESEAWWEGLDDEDKEYYAKSLIDEGFDANSLTEEQIQDLYDYWLV